VKSSITHRIFFALLIATGIMVISMALVLQWSVDRGFLRYINRLEQTRLERLADSLERSYARQNSWGFLKHDPDSMSRLVATCLSDTPPGRTNRMPPPEPPPTPEQARRLMRVEQRLLVLDNQQIPVYGTASTMQMEILRPLTWHGQTIGHLGLMPSKNLSEIHQLQFVTQQKSAYALVAVIMLLVATLLSIILARRLVRPLRDLAAATHALALGNYDVRVRADSDDELGRLSRDFNALALSLQKSEQTRRQFIADISHELRTPLAILGGEIEALQDGVRPLNQTAVSSLHGEVTRLNRLVGDLYQLALSDVGALTYRKEELDLVELLTGAVERMQPELQRAALTLTASLPHQELLIYGDSERLSQLFDNLLGNSAKYTDAGGTVAVSLACQERQLLIEVMDSSPGVPPGEEQRLFERLYRVEASRSRTSGGAGLGLAICRNIVEAHEGTIEAAPSPLGGLLIRVVLPLAEQNV